MGCERVERAWTLVLLLALGIPAHLRGEEITLFAAASLTDALQEISGAWEASTGHHVIFNPGASSDLARQILAGAPADVFFSADEAQMERVQGAGLVRGADAVCVLSNVLVVVVPSSSSALLARGTDLLRLQRIALADPEAVPAGVYARRYLEGAGLWERLRQRIVHTLDVRAALAVVESGDADAGIVYRTDAAISRRVRVAFEVPRDQGPRIVYVLAPLAAAVRRKAVVDLARYLGSPQAARIYEKHGFIALAGR